MGIFKFLRKSTQHKVVFCGLDFSGKSTIISFLKEGRFIENTPTLGKKKKEMEVEGTKIVLFDLGGQMQFRNLWLGELNTAKLCVYVIDKSDKKRYDEALMELEKLVPTLNSKHIHALILINKFDLAYNVPITELTKKIDNLGIESYEIIEISAKTGYNMANAFLKLYSFLTGEELEKITVALYIAIYWKDGKKIASEIKKNSNIPDLVLEQEIPMAIETFKQTKAPKLKLKFDLFPNYVLILARTQNFLGAMLWSEELKFPLSESEDSLFELLKHLEQSQVSDMQDVLFQVMHYCTNII